MRRFTVVFYLLLLIPFALSCGDKFDTGLLTDTGDTGNISGDTVYVPLNPSWEGFNQPQDIMIGKEPFVYVADTDNDRVVMLNLNGDILGTRNFKHPVALGQDYKLELIVCAEMDTVVNGATQTFGALYKLDMVGSSHQIATAEAKRLLPRPVDFNSPERRYTGVCVFYDNRFYVSRTGPNNSSFIDPDNSILYFSPKKLFSGGTGDTLIGRVPNIDPVSSGLVSANQISSLTSFNRNNIDFIETLTGNSNLKTQWLTYVVTPSSADYQPQLNPSTGGALMTPLKFSRPEGACIDDAGNIYVADADKDSVFKFTPFGDELQSFGGTGIFDEPYAVAHFDGVLYVADKGNNRILRFQLSTDLD